MTSRPVQRRSTRTRLVAWAPALLVVVATAVVASGVSLVPGATAANTTSVSGTVTAGMSLPVDTADGGCLAANQSVGDFTLGNFAPATGTCVLTFASNSSTGSALTMRDNDNTAPFFCTGAPAACVTGVNNSLENPSAVGPEALGNDQFGAALVSTSGNPTPAAGSEFAVDGTPGTQTGAETIWGPVGASNLTVCSVGSFSVSNQVCTVRFAVDGQGNTQASGTYGGTVYFDAATT